MSGLEPDRPTLEGWLDAFGQFALGELDAIERAPATGSIGKDGNAIADAVSVPIDEAPLAGGIAEIAERLGRAASASLYTIGGNFVPPAQCATPPCATGWSVVEVDPDTLEAKRVTGVDQNAALQGASTSLAVGDEIWIGTFRGDRVGYMPRP